MQMRRIFYCSTCRKVHTNNPRVAVCASSMSSVFHLFQNEPGRRTQKHTAYVSSLKRVAAKR